MPFALRPACHRRKASCGFTLIELSIVLVIGASFLMAMTLSWHARMLELRAQAMAQRYLAVSAAAQRYIEMHRSSLAELPPTCSLSRYQAGVPRPPGGIEAAGGCTLWLAIGGLSVKVVNALQPTVDELRALGLLDGAASVSLSLERQVRVFNPAFAGSVAILAPERLAVQVLKRCHAGACNGASGLESVVYNLQPYLLDGGNWAFSRSDQVRALFNELGDGAAMSQGLDHGMLVGAGETFTLVNPVQDERGQGISGIVAFRASVNSALDTVWARRDGQSTIAGDWNFASHKLQGVSNLEAERLQAKDLQLSGRADLNAANAQSIQVRQLSTQNLRLATAQAGLPCDPVLANIALDTDNGHVLTCSEAKMLWEVP